MSIVFTILLIIAGIIALLLVTALFMKKEYNVQSEIIINAPREKVFDYLKQLKNQDNFNKWVMVDPNMKREFKGTDGTVGFIYAWKGNKKASEGEQEIKALEEGKRIATEIRFTGSFMAVAYADYTLQTVEDNQTKVRWSNASTLKYPMNVMIPMVEKMLPKDMNVSLLNLKTILETNTIS